MAGIDHTIIRYKNGEELVFKYHKDHKYQESDYEFANDKYIFITDRDGYLHTIKNRIDGSEISSKEFTHMCPGNYYWEESFLSSRIRWIDRILWKLGIKFKEKHESDFIEHYKTDDYEIFQYSSGTTTSLFIFAGDDAFVSLGGYGHNENPYVHFYERGYGEEFKTKLLKECYEYLCEDVFETMHRELFGIDWDGDIIRAYHAKLRYKSYWDMTEEEQDAYDKMWD